MAFRGAKYEGLSSASPIELYDGHESCVFCLGLAHAEAALGGSDCPHCGAMRLRTLMLHVAIIQGNELAQLALALPLQPCLSQGGKCCELLSPRRPGSTCSSGPLPVRFMTTDLLPSPRCARCGILRCHGGY